MKLQKRLELEDAYRIYMKIKAHRRQRELEFLPDFKTGKMPAEIWKTTIKDES